MITYIQQQSFLNMFPAGNNDNVYPTTVNNPFRACFKPGNNASSPSMIVVDDRDWHWWIGPVIGRLLCIIKVVTELSEYEFCLFEIRYFWTFLRLKRYIVRVPRYIMENCLYVRVLGEKPPNISPPVKSYRFKT